MYEIITTIICAIGIIYSIILMIGKLDWMLAEKYKVRYQEIKNPYRLAGLLVFLTLSVGLINNYFLKNINYREQYSIFYGQIIMPIMIIMIIGLVIILLKYRLKINN